ncbi:hypothetical protein [Enterocloster citroniae]|uniref:hypothetical protein n=1 Tax=Clostridium sp. FS41 TaxID=1609975 RepID=UPI002ED417B0
MLAEQPQNSSSVFSRTCLPGFFSPPVYGQSLSRPFFFPWVRTTVERSINHIKDSFCLAGRKTQNETTLHADLLLAGITQLLGVLLADKIHQHQYLRSLKPLIA